MFHDALGAVDSSWSTPLPVFFFLFLIVLHTAFVTFLLSFLLWLGFGFRLSLRFSRFGISSGSTIRKDLLNLIFVVQVLTATAIWASLAIHDKLAWRILEILLATCIRRIRLRRR